MYGLGYLFPGLPDIDALTSAMCVHRDRRVRAIGSDADVIAIALVSGSASLAGYSLFQNSASSTIAFVLAFAAGAILTMLADTMTPEAFEHGGKLAGVMTTLGFAVATPSTRWTNPALAGSFARGETHRPMSVLFKASAAHARRSRCTPSRTWPPGSALPEQLRPT